MKKSYNWILIYLILVILDIFSMILFELGSEKYSLAFVEFLVIFTFSVFFIKSSKSNGILSLYSLFLIFSVFFLYSRIVFEWIGYLNRQVNDFYFFLTSIHFKDRTVFDFMFYTILYLISIDFGYYYSKFTNNRLDNRTENNTAKFFIFLCIILIMPLLLYKSYLDIKNVKLNGYQSILDRSSYPFYLKGVGTIFISLFYCLFMFKMTKKEILILIFIYLIYSFTSSLRGSRSVFFIPFVFSFYVLWRLDIIKISFFKLIIIASCSILLIAWFTVVLRGERISDSSLSKIFKYILYGQGNSIGVPLYYLEYKDYIDARIQLPLFLEDWFSFFTNFFHKGSYYVALVANKKNVEGGLGESIYVELLNLPLVFSLPVSFCFGKILKKVEMNLLSNRFRIPFFLLLSQWLFVLARFAFFNFLDLYGICEMFLTVVLFLFFNNCSKYILKVRCYA